MRTHIEEDLQQRIDSVLKRNELTKLRLIEIFFMNKNYYVLQYLKKYLHCQVKIY